MVRKKARNWYWWLWLSPLLTIPTFAILWLLEIGDDFYVIVAVLVSALWHLILLIPALDRTHPFVRWHGRQALLLAAVRTAIPLAFGLVIGATLLFIPVQIVVWFGGTLWGQLQAARGDCSLMRWFGQEELLSSIQEMDVEAPLMEADVQTLVEIIRVSRDPAERERAVEELTKRGMVEAL